jgi:23S rRNA pseudouridine1911/1915/1917 synthase
MEPVVLFEDNHCLAVAKPAPLPTQAVADVPSLESWAKDYLRQRFSKPGNVYLGVPHRLDRPVSGVVLFARNSKAAARLAEQFRVRSVEKVYWAMVDGVVDPADGVWEDWLRKVPDQARVEAASDDVADAKPAQSQYRRLSVFGDRTFVELRPRTGRTHQLRVQAAARGHPVLGDELYGCKRPFGPPAEMARDSVIALHARELRFLHPIRYEPMTVTAPLPDYWPFPTDLAS